MAGNNSNFKMDKTSTSQPSDLNSPLLFKHILINSTLSLTYTIKEGKIGEIRKLVKF